MRLAPPLRGWPGLTLAGRVGAVYPGALSTALCYWGWLHGLRRVMPGAMAPPLFIQPLGGTALAGLILGEQPFLTTLTRAH